MNHRRVWAWLVLGIFLLGVVGAVVSIATKNNGLTIPSIVLILLGAVGTYFLKKDAEAEYEEKKAPKPKRESPWDNIEKDDHPDEEQ